MIHNNSIKTYYEEKRKLGKRATEIFVFMLGTDGCLTDRQIQLALGYAERNSVQPRITELIKSGHLYEVGRTKCQMTNKMVRLVSCDPTLVENNES